MNGRLAISITVMVCVAFGWAIWLGTPSAMAIGEANLIATGVDMAAAAAIANGTDKAKKANSAKKAEYTYVGSKKCKKCHIKQHKSWSKTKMGKAFDTLKPGEAKEAKEKFNLDVKKDYTKDKTCLKCHTTGYGEPGGYEIPDPKDKKAVKRAKALQGVGCESCHGPGSGFTILLEDIFKSKRKYKPEELWALGMQQINKDSCLSCHNEESPTLNKESPFDYEKQKADGIHDNIPLKQRIEPEKK